MFSVLLLLVFAAFLLLAIFVLLTAFVRLVMLLVFTFVTFVLLLVNFATCCCMQVRFVSAASQLLDPVCSKLSLVLPADCRFVYQHTFNV